MQKRAMKFVVCIAVCLGLVIGMLPQSAYTAMAEEEVFFDDADMRAADPETEDDAVTNTQEEITSEEDSVTENDGTDETDVEAKDDENDEAETEDGEEFLSAADAEDAFEQSRTVDGVKVTVKADEGVFSSDAEISVQKVSDEEATAIDDAVAEVRDEDCSVAVSYLFDIKVLDEDGEEIEPDTDKGQATVIFDAKEAGNQNLQTDVYHVTGEAEDDLSAEKMTVENTDDTIVEVETDSFSFYTVEFTYGNLQYVLQGDAEVPLSDILGQIGLTGEATNAESSNSNLFEAVQRDGAWFVVAKQAFQSDEWLKVTIDEVVYQVAVTDDIGNADLSVKRTPLKFYDKNIYPKWGMKKFTGDATDGNADIDLAVTGLALSWAAEDAVGTVMNTAVSLGFDNLQPLNYNRDWYHTDYPALMFAMYPQKVNGKYLILGVFRGTDPSDANDLNEDTRASLNRFLTPGKNAETALENYIAACEENNNIDLTSNNTILFLTGHSLGAAIAGEVARLSDNVVSKKENTFVYTFGCPHYDTEGATGYNNIHNYINRDDFITDLLWITGDRLGNDHFYEGRDISIIEILSATTAGTPITKTSDVADAWQWREFLRIFDFIHGTSYYDDKNALGIDLPWEWRDHLPYTYMSFILSDLAYDDDLYAIDRYLVGETEVEKTPSGYITIGSVSPDTISDYSEDAIIHIGMLYTLSNVSEATISISYKKADSTTVEVASMDVSASREGKSVDITIPAEVLSELNDAGENLEISAVLTDKSTGQKLMGKKKEIVLKKSDDDWYKNYNYSTKSGKIYLRQYTGNEENVIIPATATIEHITYDTVITSSCAFESKNTVKTITIKDGVSVGHISIGGYEIGGGLMLFRNCTNLTDAKIGSLIGLTSMKYMFRGCSNLLNVNLEGLDTSNVTDMSGMFNACVNLEKVDLSGLDTSNVTNMRGMFLGCSELERLDISNFETSSVTNMSYMFEGCSNLKSLDVSHFDTQKVIDMSGMFCDCSSLESLNVSNFNTANVCSMYSMFKNCGSLKELDLSNFDTQNVTGMGYMFNRCTELETIIVSNFDTENVYDMSNMFTGCANLKKLDLHSFDLNAVVPEYNEVELGSMFVSLFPDNLEELYAPKAINTNISIYLGGYMYAKQFDGTLGTTRYSHLEEVPANSILYGKSLSKATVTLDHNNYIYDCSPKKPNVTVKIDDTTLIEGTHYHVNYKNNLYAGIATVTISDMNGQNAFLDSISKEFTIEKAERQMTVSLSNTTLTTGKTVYDIFDDDENAVRQDWAYEYFSYTSSDTSVAEVNEEGDVTAKKVGTAIITVNVQETANFKPATAKATITVVASESPQEPSEDTADEPTNNIPQNNTSNNSGASTNTASRTNGSTSTNSASGSASGSSASSSGGSGGGGGGGSSSGRSTYSAGKGTTKAEYSKAGNSTAKYESSSENVNATSAKIPAKVKINGKSFTVTTVGSQAFVGYDKLKSVTIGKNVKKIGISAFSGCKNLTTLTVKSKKLTQKSVKGSLKGSSVDTVYVPADKLDAYKKIFTKKITGSKNKIAVKAKKTDKKK